MQSPGQPSEENPLSFASLHRVNEYRVRDSPARRTAQFRKFTQSERIQSLGQPTARIIAQFRKFTQSERMQSLGQPTARRTAQVRKFTQSERIQSLGQPCPHQGEPLSFASLHIVNEYRVWYSPQRGEPLSFASLHRVSEYRVWDSPAHIKENRSVSQVYT